MTAEQKDRGPNVSVIPLKKLRIVSYNIRHGLGMDERVSLSRISTVLKSLHPDLVALQEVDRHQARSAAMDQMRVLGEELGMEARFKQSCFIEEGEYGIGILSRFPITKTIGYTLSQAKEREPRSALEIQVSLKETMAPLSFLSIHTDHLTEEARVQEMRIVLEFLENHENPLVLAGDFNTTRGAPSLQLLEDAGWHILDKQGAITYYGASAEENAEIDFVALKNFECRVTRHEVIEEKMASDHCPLIVESKTPGKAGGLKIGAAQSGLF